MSAKIDYAFKLVFGDENNKDILIDLLGSILQIPLCEFDTIEYINTELFKYFKDDKKGILDIRIKTAKGKQIDIEIQLLNTQYMAERALFYWSKMFSSQIKSGDNYNKLKKCISINILGYEFIPLNFIHTQGHIWDINKKYKLTDMLEIHFLELPKLYKAINDKNDPAISWLEFINAESKGVMKMLAKKNDKINRAYKILEAASRDEKKRLAYEAREAALMDESTRIDEAYEKGIQEGDTKRALKVALKLIDNGADIEFASKISELPIDVIEAELNK